MRVFAQNDVESAAFRAEHLPAIAFAHRRDLVGENDSALEQIQPAKKLDAARREVSLGQIRQGKIKAPETSLLRKMMDREDRGERQVLMVHQHGHERRGPVM